MSRSTLNPQPSKPMEYKPHQLVTGWAEFIQQRIEQGWEPTLITLMFNPLPGSHFAVAEQMRLEVERIYGFLLTRGCRRPDKTPRDRLPFLLACLDFPVPKQSKDHFADLAINDGRHVHGGYLMPPWTRGASSLADRIADLHASLAGPHRVLQRLHAVTITKTPERATAYLLKSLPRRRIGADEFIIMPRATGEARYGLRSEDDGVRP